MSVERIPSIVLEGYHGISAVNLAAKHLADGKIFLTGEITDEVANTFVQEFLYLKEKGEPVTIYINTPGGSISAGLIIYDLIQAATDLEIHMVCVGGALSMGAILLAGGQKGRRHILPHAQVMLHEPRIASGIVGSVTSIQSLSESMIHTKKMMNEILLKHTGRSRKEIEKVTRSDCFMNAEQSVAFGICDDILHTI